MFPKRILNVDLLKAYLPKCTHIFFSNIIFFNFVVSVEGDMVACSRATLKWFYLILDQEVPYFRERPAEGRDKRSSVQRQQQKSSWFRLARNKFARTSHFFVHFLAVVARLHVDDLTNVDRSTIMDVHHCQTQRMQRRTFMGIACVAGGISVGVLFWWRSPEKSAYKSIWNFPSRLCRSLRAVPPPVAKKVSHARKSRQLRRLGWLKHWLEDSICQLLLTICDANKQAQCQRHSVRQDNLDKIEFLHQFWCHLSSSILQVPNTSVWRHSSGFQSELDGISVIKFEAARIHFLSDVFVAVAVVVTPGTPWNTDRNL